VTEALSGRAYGPRAPGSYFTATGTFGGRPAWVRWTGRWAASEPALLHLVLSYLMLQGWGDGVETEMHCPPGIMGFGAASEVAAREVLGDSMVIDCLYQDAPEGCIGATTA